MPDETEVERTLVAAVVERGDESAFRGLYRRHAGALRAFVRGWLDADPERIDDALQETWLRAVRRLPHFQWQSSLRTWLISIAINCCRELVRPHQLQLVRDPNDATAPPGDAPLDARIDLESALSRIAAGYREILLLHDVHGLTHEEIAALLGIEPGTSKSQLSRARATLRKLLGPSYTSPNAQDSANA